MLVIKEKIQKIITRIEAKKADSIEIWNLKLQARYQKIDHGC